MGKPVYSEEPSKETSSGTMFTSTAGHFTMGKPVYSEEPSKETSSGTMLTSTAGHFTMGKPWYYEEPSKETSSGTMYSKRAGTSGIRGQLYEIKLVNLLYFRAIHDDTIQELQLATNVDKVGAFDDICFKAKVKGHDKPVTVFIQAQHKANKRQTLEIDLPTYFDSYKKIRENFGQIFEGTFDETECLFVIFTNANVDYSDAPTTSGLAAKLNGVLDTGGVVKQPNSEENIEYLTKKIVQDEITSLAEWVVRFICDKKNFQFILSHELVLRYHVILAQKVFEVSDIQPLESNDAPQYRIASFRQDFFDNTEEYITLFRATLYLEVIKRRRIEPAELRLGLSEFLGDLTDAIRLSKLLGSAVTYNNGQLEFDKKSTKALGHMKPIDVSQSTVSKAVELAAREMLSTVKFKVPAAFGNIDLTLSGSDAKIEKRICYLTSKMKDLLDKCQSSKVVTIDESLDAGFLQLNGGIAGAVGNIFVLDDNTNFMKITDNCETLGTRAKSLYTKLKSEVHNLHEYKFCFKIYKFPELSFDCSHYEEKMARDFLDKMLVYSNQADETDLEGILKNEIADIQRNQPNYFQAKTDLIYLRYYDEIQKWWIRPQDASYLTKRINLFRQLIDEIFKDPLMSSINKTYYTSKVKQHDYTFTEDAVRSLNLPDQLSSTIIVAGSCLLTVVKVLQHLKSKQVQHVVLDLEYITRLPTNDLNALRAELLNTNKDKVLILVCDQIYSKDQTKITKNIAESAKNKINIIITDQKSLEILPVHKYFPEADKILYDKKFSINDVCPESQRRILESATVVFPGVDIRLQHLLRSWPKTGVTSAGETDTAAVVDASDKLTAQSSRPFGDEHQDAQKMARKGSSSKTDTQEENFSSSSSSSSGDEESAGETDTAAVVDASDKLTAQSSRLFGDDHQDGQKEASAYQELTKQLCEWSSIGVWRSTGEAEDISTTEACDAEISGVMRLEYRNMVKLILKSLDPAEVADMFRTNEKLPKPRPAGGEDTADKDKIQKKGILARYEPSRRVLASRNLTVVQWENWQPPEDVQVSTFFGVHAREIRNSVKGRHFYNAFKDAEFLKIDRYVDRLLTQGHKLRMMLATYNHDAILIIGMNVDQNIPLVIKNFNYDLNKFEFTYDRLVGLAAAYAYENRQKFPNLVSSEAVALGLEWDQSDEDKCKLYLSAVTGAQHFIDQFSFCPFLCGMRKYQLKMIDEILVVWMGRVKNENRETMATVLKRNLVAAEKFWLMFPDNSHGDLQTLITSPIFKELFNH